MCDNLVQFFANLGDNFRLRGTRKNEDLESETRYNDTSIAEYTEVERMFQVRHALHFLGIIEVFAPVPAFRI